MAVESDLLDLMLDSITVEPYASMDNYGQPTYSAGVARQCRLEATNDIYRTLEGVEVVAQVIAYMADNYGITTKDRITLPDGTKPKLLHVETLRDEHGVYAQVVIT